jgi:ferredoxin
MRVRIDHETCLLSGKCTFFHPELFAERDDGYPEPRATPIGAELQQALLDAIDACPTGAIALVDEDVGPGPAAG